MRFDTSAEYLRQCVAVLTLTAGVTIGPTSLASTTMLFEQPLESGIAKNFFVAHVTKQGLPTGVWDLVALQPNPDTSTHALVPTSWDAGSKTGFVPTSPSTAQLGFRNEAGTSTAQMEGDTVGAYINSADLPTTRSNQLMMISPQYKYQVGLSPVPFASSASVLNGEMDLQIPTAVGKKTYVSADLSFVNASGMRICFSVNVFHNEVRRELVLAANYNAAENVYVLDVPLQASEQFITVVHGSSVATGIPWLGYRHFQWTINETQFVAALKYLAEKFPGKINSTDPTQYVFDEVHLNAEFSYSPAPAELGWSMQGLTVWVSD